MNEIARELINHLDLIMFCGFSLIADFHDEDYLWKNSTVRIFYIIGSITCGVLIGQN